MNKDGLSDIVGIESSGLPITALGHGDATFTVPPTAPISPYGSAPVLSDFNGDGIPDVVSVNPFDATSVLFTGNLFYSGAASIVFAKGNSDGTFTFVSRMDFLPFHYPKGIVAGDFNGDGKQDIAISFDDTISPKSGIALMIGNADGTFANPLFVASDQVGVTSRVFASDLNGDGRLDLIWGANAYINQGNNTFTPLALPGTGTPLLLADLNGDKLTDIVIDNFVYAGKGDGTFLSPPVATITTPPGASFINASAGDVNGDDNPDLIIQSLAGLATFTVAFGDGHGSFTTDPNLYTTGSVRPVIGAFARLNNSALPLTSNKRLDYIVFASGAAVPLLNQINPPSVSTRGLQSAFRLDPGFASAAPLAPAAFVATVSSSGNPSPTGTVTFTGPDGTTLGTVPLELAMAKIQTSFPTEGTYTVSATYSGDVNYALAGPTSASVKIVRQKYPVFLTLSATTFLAQRPSQLVASFSGYNPTNPITFTANGNVIGTAPVNGTLATLSYAFPSVGTYDIVTSYPGDASSLPSISDATTITTVPPPDFSLSASPETITVNAGDKANWTITVTSVNNYTGYVTMVCQQDSCGTIQVYVAPNQPGQVTLSLQTHVPSANEPTRPNIRLSITASALLLLGVSRKRSKRCAPRLNIGFMVLCLLMGLGSISGCSGSSSSSGGGTTSKPPTSYNIVVVGSETSFSISHTLTLTLVVK
nr:FG-GAP-like repeat-containing protein [Edaphobacter aggregans]